MSHFVLIHGGCHTGGCWDEVARRLAARGSKVDAPTLPGHGREAFAAGQAATLTDGIAAVTEILRTAAEPVVLVGHSLGGMAISGAAEAAPDRVRRLVYVSALYPRDGECANDAFARPEFAEASAGSTVIDASGEWVSVKPEAARTLFYDDCDDAVATAAIAALGPTHVGYMSTPVRLSEARYGRPPKLYVSCLRDAAIPLAMQRALIAGHPGTTVRELDCGHSPFLSRPDALADVLAAAGV